MLASPLMLLTPVTDTPLALSALSMVVSFSLAQGVTVRSSNVPACWNKGRAGSERRARGVLVVVRLGLLLNGVCRGVVQNARLC